MKEFLNENTLFNTIALFLDVSDELLLVVEGPDDELLLKRFCGPQLKLMSATGGRSQALSAAKLAHLREVNRVRFLVDRDYDSFSHSKVVHPDNVFFSDNHDCFLDLIYQDRSLLCKVIDVYCAPARRRDGYTGSIPDSETLEEQAFSLANMLAATRIVDAKRNLFLDFKRFKFGGISADEFDVAKITEILLNRSQYHEPDRTEIIFDAVSTYSQVEKMEFSPVGDHDLFSAIARMMKTYGANVSDDNLRRGYILTISGLVLGGIGWFASIQEWCESFGKIGFINAQEQLV